jgi:hypothetical protein
VSSDARGFVVEPRFCGPPRSGNGGYVSGRLAGFLAGSHAVEVTLRSPPPLGVRLEISDADDDGLVLCNGEVLVAQAKSAELAGDLPEPVSISAAADAAGRYAGRRGHPFPTCFVCGLDRSAGDGMRLQPGSIGGPGRVAAAWTPDSSVADGAGLAAEFVWAALDCPGGWATNLSGRPMVLGRMTASVLAVPELGQPCVVVGQLRGLDGRKAFTSSALFSADGELLARAEATWLEIDPAAVVPK